MPVDPENFEGMKYIIEIYIKELGQSLFGNSRHFFVSGERGMGKSSLADYLIECSKIKYDMVGVHVYNDGVHTTEQLISNIIEKILNEITTEKWSEKIIDKFREHIDTVGFLDLL